MKSIKIGLCGLENLGNTCFLNTVLQLILHCPSIIDFLINKRKERIIRDLNGHVMLDDNNIAIREDRFEGDYVEYLENVIKIKFNTNKEAEPLTLDKLTKEKENTITHALSNIVNDIYRNGSGEMKPSKFKYILGEKNPRFKSFSQEDSQEALMLILDTIFSETESTSNFTVNNIPPEIVEYNEKHERAKHFAENMRKMYEENKNNETTVTDIKKMLEDYNDKHRKYRLEFYNNPKNVNLLKQYNGTNFMCSYYSKHYNPLITEITIFTISIVKCESCGTENCTYENQNMLDVHVKSTLNESLQDYAKTEEISGYMCETCGVHRTVSKTMKIWHNPQILFIHIKRYVQTFHNDRVVMRKNTVEMELPHELDISVCCEIASHVKSPNKTYKLIGISNHHSRGLQSGHYTTDCRSFVDGNWYNYNDNCIASYDKDEIKNINTSNAYLAMYERVNV